jgi:hypothetical protein
MRGFLTGPFVWVPPERDYSPIAKIGGVRNEKRFSKSVLPITTTFGVRGWVEIFFGPHNLGT